MSHSLTLGALLLTDELPEADHGYSLSVLAEGASFGTPQAVREIVRSLLADGDLVRTTRHGNRQVTVRVQIEGPTLAAVAEGEAALRREVGRRNTLTWQAPDILSVPTVFEIVDSEMSQSFDDLDELRMRRTFELTFEALPFPRSAEKVVTPAAGAASTVVIDDGSSTTGWVARKPTGAVLSVVSGMVTSTYDGTILDGFYGTDLVRTFGTPVDTTTHKYLGIEWTSSRPMVHAARVNGSPINLSEVRRDTLSGLVRSWYKVPDDVSSLSEVMFGAIHPSTAGMQTLKVNQVQVTNVLPFGSNVRQSMSVLTAGGSVPTDGTIHLYHPTAGLGTALVFTKERRVAYQPPLSPWKTGGRTFSANGYDIAGGQTDISSTAITYRLPANILPDSDAIIIAKLYSNPTGTVKINYSVRSGIGSTPVGPPDVGSVDVSLNSTAWTWVMLGKFRLPPSRVGAQGYVDVQIQRDAASVPSVYIDEAFMLSTEGQLTIVDCGGTAAGGETPASGTVANHLWIEAPSLENETGAIWLGTDPTGADRWHASSDQIIAWGMHEFDPVGTDVFAANQGAPSAALEFEHFPRWQSNAAS